jgi:hypothetical protein
MVVVTDLSLTLDAAGDSLAAAALLPTLRNGHWGSFWPNGPVYEAHPDPAAGVVIPVQLLAAVATVAERPTLGATRHHGASGCHARSVERR